MKRKQVVLFISTPSHGNLGDHAIVYAQHKLFSDMGLQNNVLEIHKKDFLFVKAFLPKMLSQDDIIIIDGGGNIGTLWIDEENKMRDIIQRFPDNPIIIFPQTAYFEDSEYGQRELAKSVQIYDAHKKLTVFCRDKATYELFQNRFLHTESYFTPDTVLYLTPQPPKKKSDTILFCFRADSEKTSLGDQVHNTAKALIQARGLHMEETSTVLNHDVSAKQRQQFLQEKWTQFASARLIITDRLHGMIFSAICGTPCIALDNVSKKVSGGAYWLKHLPYISVIDSAEQCECAIREKLENQSESLYNRDPLNAYYDEMKNVVLHYVRK